MSHRRRAYPQPSYSYQAAGAAAGQPAYPGVADPNALGGAGPAAPGTDAYAPQADQLAQGVNQMNLGSNPGYGSPTAAPAYGNPAAGAPNPAAATGGFSPAGGAYANPGYAANSTANNYLQSTGAYGSGTYAQQPDVMPLNELYSTDLLGELPPPIRDLQFPPPPVILPPSAQTTPSESANPDYEYFRSTLNVVPASNGLLKKSKLPLALVVRPYLSLRDEDSPVPIVEDCVISRCRRCRAYINPFIHFTENGRRWRCNFCGLLNDVPAAFDFNQETSQQVNRMDRKEINYGVVEFMAPPQYMVRPPQPLVYVFVLDVCKFSIQNGLLGTVTRTILESLDRIPECDGRTRVAFMAVDAGISYFSIPRDDEPDKETRMMIVSDIEETLVPAPEGLLVNLKECRANVEKLLANIPEYFANSVSVDSALGPALKAAHRLIENLGGKIEVFTSTLPSVGVGKLTVRDENSVSNRPKEASALLSPNAAFYKSFAVECSRKQVSVDMFLAGSSYQDVATLSNLPRVTSGQTHFYPAWSANNVEDITKLSKEIYNQLSMEMPLEAVLRVRGSSGLRMSSFYGNFFNRSSDLCSFPTFPRDQAFVIEVSVEDTITRPTVFFQCAVLHTTVNSDRRIRVMTLALPTSKELKDIYASADQLAIANYYTHRAIERTLSYSLNDARDMLLKTAVDILSVYKKEIVAGNVGSSTPLQISTNLRMLPLLLQSLSKNIAFRSGRVPSDHRAAALNRLGSIPLPHLIKAIYPSVYSLHDMVDEAGLPFDGEDDPDDIPAKKHGEIVIPEAINATGMVFQRFGLYLIDNSSELFLYVGGDAVPQLIEDVFGVPSVDQITIGKTELPVIENEFAERVRNIISKVREGSDAVEYMSLYVVVGPGSNEANNNSARSRDLIPLRIWYMSNMVEDRATSNLSYKEYLAQLREKVSN